MFPDGRDHAIVQRGIDEALACRDMLTPAPARLSLAARFVVRIGAMRHAVQSALVRAQPRRRPVSGSITETIR